MKRGNSLNTNKPPRKQKRTSDEPKNTAAADVNASMFSARNMKRDFFGGSPAKPHQPAKSPQTNFSDMSGDEVLAQFEMSLDNLQDDNHVDDDGEAVDELAPVFRSESQEQPKKKSRKQEPEFDAPAAVLLDDEKNDPTPPANEKQEVQREVDKNAEAPETDVGSLWYSMLTSFI